mmetsp:Transcript_16361/g.35765  ORF Transcript_16361/g.35765 Transcript_16361/m.35765 type:complete len:443 (+) Transcript_16361:92-1420(+)
MDRTSFALLMTPGSPDDEIAPPQVEIVKSSEDFWRVQLEAIYRKRNPQKFSKVPDLLRKYRGQEAVLYRKVCQSYDLDPTKFYTDEAAWGEEAMDVDAGVVEEVEGLSRVTNVKRVLAKGLYQAFTIASVVLGWSPMTRKRRSLSVMGLPPSPSPPPPQPEVQQPTAATRTTQQQQQQQQCPSSDSPAPDSRTKQSAQQSSDGLLTPPARRRLFASLAPGALDPSDSPARKRARAGPEAGAQADTQAAEFLPQQGAPISQGEAQQDEQQDADDDEEELANVEHLEAARLIPETVAEEDLQEAEVAFPKRVKLEPVSPPPASHRELAATRCLMTQDKRTQDNHRSLSPPLRQQTRECDAGHFKFTFAEGLSAVFEGLSGNGLKVGPGSPFAAATLCSSPGGATPGSSWVEVRSCIRTAGSSSRRVLQEVSTKTHGKRRRSLDR